PQHVRTRVPDRSSDRRRPPSLLRLPHLSRRRHHRVLRRSVVVPQPQPATLPRHHRQTVPSRQQRSHSPLPLHSLAQQRLHQRPPSPARPPPPPASLPPPAAATTVSSVGP